MHLFRSKQSYLPIPALPESPIAPGKTEEASRVRRLLVIPVVAVFSFALGAITAAVILVSFGPPSPTEDNDFLQPTKLDVTIPLIRQTFKYNRTFSEDPQLNNSTAEVWESIVPRMSQPRPESLLSRC